MGLGREVSFCRRLPVFPGSLDPDQRYRDARSTSRKGNDNFGIVESFPRNLHVIHTP